MLKKLYVKNYALIKEMELDFDRGLTIITGETGAGKSILLGALGLVLGQRADTGVLLDRKSKCVVEGVFSIEGEAYIDFFEQNDLDFSATCLMRREISNTGRSRAFINDTPVTLDLMKELGTWMLDIHSQHQTLMLGKKQFQLAVLDSFAGHNGLLSAYSGVYHEFRKLENEYLELKLRMDRDKEELEYYNHQLMKLDEVKLQAGEEAEAEKERNLLLNASEVRESLAALSAIISGDEDSVILRLNEVKKRIERITEFLPESSEYIERLQSSVIELNDLANEVERKHGLIESDPGRLEYLNSRLDTIFGLMQRHRVESVSDLISIRESLRQKVNEIILSDDKLEAMDERIHDLKKQLAAGAREISENRKRVSETLESRMGELLKSLGMPNGRFAVSIKTLNDFSSSGLDYVDFLFSANKQVAPENLNRVASGGELSRVMLSLKSLLTDNSKLPTIFFDEIDSGVSGEVATKVGEILAAMGAKMQVINITHLPQVAAHGNMHYHVYKEESGDSTITHIKLLDKKQRLNEIARLLSGNEITDASLQNARELINGA